MGFLSYLHLITRLKRLIDYQVFLLASFFNLSQSQATPVSQLRPGTDTTSKFIMNDETVKNIIINELLGNFVIFAHEAN